MTIVRILGEGQYRVSDQTIEQLNQLDESLMGSIERGDEASFRSDLGSLLAGVRSEGTHLADDELLPSDLVLPGEDSSLDQVRELLGDEGLIPG